MTDAGQVRAPVGVPVGVIVGELRRRELTLACAESLTAGLLTARIADVPGASAVLRGGVVAYATGLKAELLGVSAELLAAQGAVSAATAAAMAAGVRTRLGADVGLALTGVAGPEPQEGHPPGIVYVALDAPALGGPAGRALQLAGGRADVRRAAVDGSLDLLASVLRLG